MKATLFFILALCVSACTATASYFPESIRTFERELAAEYKDETNGTGCGCVNYTCGCCAYLKVPKIGLNDTACVNLTYLSKDIGIALTFSVDGKVYFKEEVSVRNPPPVCVNVPYLKKFASLCVVFYNLDVKGGRLSGCVRIVAKLEGFKVESIEIGCFHIPPANSKQLKYMKQLPSDRESGTLNGVDLPKDWDDFVKLAGQQNGDQGQQLLQNLFEGFHSALRTSKTDADNGTD